MKLLARPVAILVCVAVALSPLALAAVNASAAPVSKAATSTVAPRPATTLTVTLPKALYVGRSFTASARLVRAGGVPVRGQVVTFSQSGGLATYKRTTDAAGVARLTFLRPKAGSLRVSAAFAGSRTLAASRGTATRVVLRSATTLTVTMPKVLPNGWLFNASARLLRAGVPVAGQVVTFTQTGVGNTGTRKAVTDATGTARITVAAPWYGRFTLTASFAGSGTLAPSKATAARVLADPERG